MHNVLLLLLLLLFDTISLLRLCRKEKQPVLNENECSEPLMINTVNGQTDELPLLIYKKQGEEFIAFRIELKAE